MDGAGLATHLAVLFGTHKGALADAGRAFSVDPSNLWRMIKDQRPVPAGLAGEVRRRIALHGVTPPPSTLAPDMDRDGPCGEALDPHLDDLLRRAGQVGWEPAEIVAATLTWSVQRAISGAGPEAARELLNGAIEIVDASVAHQEPADAVCS